MSLEARARGLRVVTADGWPGGSRIIEGKRPTRCIHGRPLTIALGQTTDRTQAREMLCRLCVWEVPRMGRSS